MATPTKKWWEKYDCYRCYLEAELSAQIAAKRIAQDECERLEGELAHARVVETVLRKIASEDGSRWEDDIKAGAQYHRERDEARAVAGQLLRLARAQRIANEGKTITLADWREIRDALAALPAVVRRLLQDA